MRQQKCRTGRNLPNLTNLWTYDIRSCRKWLSNCIHKKRQMSWGNPRQVTATLPWCCLAKHDYPTFNKSRPKVKKCLLEKLTDHILSIIKAFAAAPTTIGSICGQLSSFRNLHLYHSWENCEEYLQSKGWQQMDLLVTITGSKYRLVLSTKSKGRAHS